MSARLLSTMAMILCSASAAATAAAQTTGTTGSATPADTASSGGLEEIVVTATRREERLQDVPVTVTAITNATLGGAGVSEMRNLTQVIPGFNGGRNIGVTQPVIRGVGSSGVSPGDEANVATYIDGIYQADPFSTSIELVEVERVEVLRGPQGTVFGRNATGGLINIITPDPSFNARGRVSARYGRMRNEANDYDLRGYVTGGLTETLAADLAAMYRKNDAYFKNLVVGGDDYGTSRVITVRSKLLFQPSDSAKFILSGDYADSNDEVNAVQPYQGNTAAKLVPGVIVPAQPWQAALSFEPISDYERYNLGLRTQFKFENMNLETSTGYMHTKNIQDTDSDASNIFRGSTTVIPAEIETLSQEVRLLSAGGGRFNWILGAYAFHLDGLMEIELAGSAGPGFPINRSYLTANVETTSYAGFAEGTYELADALFLTVGGRYTTEDREFQQAVNRNPLPFGTAKKSFNKWTYRVALRYNFAEDANIYASYGTGFKSGVFNALGTSPIATDPETINAAEIGIKADPLPWLRTNLSIYHYDYKDLQVQTRSADGLAFVLQNAATAEIYGGELEVTAAATDDLQIRGSVAYTHANYDRFPAAQVFLPLPQGGNQAALRDVSGNQMIRAPRYTFNLGANYGFDLGGGRTNITGNVFHSAKVYYDFLNLAVQKAYTLASGEIAWTSPSEAWRFSLWATNLTNAKVAQQISPGALATYVIHERPRRIGIGAQFNF